MVVISTKELSQSKNKYFDMALSQPIFLRRKQRLFELRPVDSNPSPSGDPYFLNPANIVAIERGAQQVRERKVTRLTPELKKSLFGDV